MLPSIYISDSQVDYLEILDKVSASLESSTSPCDWSVGFKIPEGGKKPRAEVAVMNENEAKVRNESEVEIEKGKRAKVRNGSKVEAKKGDDEAAQEVEIEDSEDATEVPTPDQNLTVPSEERLGCLIASN